MNDARHDDDRVERLLRRTLLFVCLGYVVLCIVQTVAQWNRAQLVDVDGVIDRAVTRLQFARIVEGWDADGDDTGS